MTKASDIAQGQFFRKRTGTYVYLRISPSSAKFLKLDENKIYGVCFNGNTVTLSGDTLVVPCTLGDFVKNIDDYRAWHREVIGQEI